MRVTAFCPGHITGFFEPCEHKYDLHTGSRGAGICVNLGATTTVTSVPGHGDITVHINGIKCDAPVTRRVVNSMVQDKCVDIIVDSAMDLPIGEGFGMSAAGALSTAFALTEVLEVEPIDAWKAAHRAELANMTGLGDVPALTRGGVTFRKREGLPPFGQITRLADRMDIIAAVVGPSMGTSEVLRDPARRKTIARIGKECCDHLLEKPTLDNFFKLSKEFMSRTDLATPGVNAAINAIDGLGQASMIMLGNSVFARGDIFRIGSILSKFGPVFRLSTDMNGPRVLVVED